METAADDPSGLAIAESLQTKVNGLDEGARSIQDATHALTVADGAMQTISGILQRMRVLVVQARTDLMSPAQRGDLQAEMDQLVHEINAIAEKANFNGKTLLDGSLSTAAAQPARALIVTNSSLTGGGTLIDTVTDPSQPTVWTQTEQFTQLLTVDSYDPVAGALNLTATISSQDAAFGPSQTATVQVPVGTNNPGPPFFSPPAPGSPTYTQFDQYGNAVLSFNTGTLNPGDVGASSLIISLPPEAKASGAGLTINTGNSEGSVVTLDIKNVSAATLGVNDIQLSNTDDLLNQGNEARIDYAIQTLAGDRATVGAQIVSLQEEANGDAVASVNYASAQSSIRDLKVGAGVTDYTRDQILVSLGTKMIVSMQQLQKGLAFLLTTSIVR